MTTLEIVEKQIAGQIEGIFAFNILAHKSFLNTKVSFYEQDSACWIEPALSKTKKISKEMIEEIKEKLDYSNIKFCTDLPFIRVSSDDEYNAFFEKYYNSI